MCNGLMCNGLLIGAEVLIGADEDYDGDYDGLGATESDYGGRNAIE